MSRWTCGRSDGALRAAIDKSRYYSVQLTDLYTFNYGYIGTRASGTDAGCYMVTGRLESETPLDRQDLQQRD